MNSTTLRSSYHTNIKFLARDGLLSKGTLKQIPRSNIHRWKREQPDKYQAFDLGIQGYGDYELVKSFIEHKTAKRVFAAYVRIIKTVVSLAHSLPGFHRAVKERSKQVVEIIKRAQPIIGLMRTLRLFNLSVPTFRQWSLQTFTHCFESLTHSCNRVFPNQLSCPQVVLLKELLSAPKFQFWPVSSIALYALRENILPLNLNTWYKYVHKLGIVRPRTASRRKKNIIGVRAVRPHQLWHADITAFVTADHCKHFIYLVVDNFSRKILSWKLKDSVKAEFRKATIVDALKKVKRVGSTITLITDGGPENNLKPFPRGLPYHLEHCKAMIDVDYSNSLIEAHNKIIKYNYLYRMAVRDGAHLQNVLTHIVNDFNNRPHVSLHGLTPHEAEQNLTLDKNTLSIYVQQAGLQRRTYNRIHHCDHCKD